MSETLAAEQMAGSRETKHIIIELQGRRGYAVQTELVHPQANQKFHRGGQNEGLLM